MNIIDKKELKFGWQFHFDDGKIVMYYTGKEGSRFVHQGRATGIPPSPYEAFIKQENPQLFPPIQTTEFDVSLVYTGQSGNGWAAALVEGQVYVTNTRLVRRNNVAELAAILLALHMANQKGLPNFILYTDSTTSHGWIKEGWKAKDPVIHQLVQRLRILRAADRIAEWRWLRGHADNPGNMRCDMACEQAEQGDFSDLTEIAFAALFG